LGTKLVDLGASFRCQAFVLRPIDQLALARRDAVAHQIFDAVLSGITLLQISGAKWPPGVDSSGAGVPPSDRELAQPIQMIRIGFSD
jgi:hypothetical protein